MAEEEAPNLKKIKCCLNCNLHQDEGAEGIWCWQHAFRPEDGLYVCDDHEE